MNAAGRGNRPRALPIERAGKPRGDRHEYGLIRVAWRAAHASWWVTQEHSAVADQLQYALNYRVVIERAVGYLMGARGLDAVAAFDLLRRQARDSRRRVADVATDLLGQAMGPSQ